jgi:hypothetical protein
MSVLGFKEGFKRIRAYKAGQIPRSETQDLSIFKIPPNRFYSEK